MYIALTLPAQLVSSLIIIAVQKAGACMASKVRGGIRRIQSSFVQGNSPYIVHRAYQLWAMASDSWIWMFPHTQNITQPKGN